MQTKNIARIITSTAVATALLSGVAFADTDTNVASPALHNRGAGIGMMRGNGVVGTVTAISGTTITVTKRMPMGEVTTGATTYTVDASKATITKNGATSSLTNIALGDMLMIEGTVSGSSVAATVIRDGVPAGQGMMGERRDDKSAASTSRGVPASIIKGNGQPVIGGSVTAISGTKLTVTNASNVTYTVDVSSATIEKGRATSTVSQIAVGDRVVVQGTVNGSSVTASSVIDNGAVPTSTSGNSQASDARQMRGGFFGGIGSFLKSLFGFF